MKIVYSKVNCPGCVTAKLKLKNSNTEFKEIVLGVDMTYEEFFKKYPDVKSVPFIVEE